MDRVQVARMLPPFDAYCIGWHCGSRIHDLLWKYVRSRIVNGVVYD